MITAEEAFKIALTNNEKIETIDALLVCERRIKEAVERGCFAVSSEALLPEVAEKLGIELEEFGYSTNVIFSQRYNESGIPLAMVQINWRYKPSPQSRVEPAASFN
jgi:hypothetical protein